MSDFKKPSGKQDQQQHQVRQRQAASEHLQSVADERSAKRERRRESMADWPAANQHSPANTADTPEPAQQAAGAKVLHLDDVRRNQAAEQSDAGTKLDDENHIFRSRPVLSLRVKNREDKDVKKT